METVSENSVLNRLRDKRRRLAADQTHDMPIPGYGGELVVRYRLLDPLVEGKEIGQRIQQQYPKAGQETEMLHAVNLDTIVNACVGFYVRREDGDLVLLDPDGTGGMDYGDPRLREFLDFDAESAREAVVLVFGGNRAAVNVHAAQLQKWMGDTSGELNEGLLG